MGQIDTRRPHQIEKANTEYIAYQKENLPVFGKLIEEMEEDYKKKVADITPGEEPPDVIELQQVIQASKKMKASYEDEILFMLAQNVWFKAQQQWQVEKRKKQGETLDALEKEVADKHK